MKPVVSGEVDVGLEGRGNVQDVDVPTGGALGLETNLILGWAVEIARGEGVPKSGRIGWGEVEDEVHVVREAGSP